MGKKLTYEYVKNFVEIESKSGCKLLSKEYVGYNKKLKYICKCKNVFEASFSKFKERDKRRCNTCSRKTQGRKSNSNKKVKNFIEQEYKIVKLKWIKGVYTNNQSKLTLIDNFGYKYYLSLSALQALNRFETQPKKFCKRNIYTIDNIRHYFKIKNIPYKVLSENFTGTNDKITLKCDKGHVYDVILRSFMYGSRCPHCCIYTKKTIDEIKEYLKIYDYSLISKDYKESHSPILIKCPEGHTYKSTWASFQSGKRCTVCKESIGENKIRLWLENNGIEYKKEYSFNNLYGEKGKLRFDFAIFKNNQLEKLIEFDGEFHFIQKPNFNNLKQQQKYDSIKNNYCDKNSIPLLRIPYWEVNNIEKILEKELKENE